MVKTKTPENKTTRNTKMVCYSKWTNFVNIYMYTWMQERCRVKRVYHEHCNPIVFCPGKRKDLLLLSDTVHIIPKSTPKSLELEVKLSWISNQEFYCAASFVVYTLYNTNLWTQTYVRCAVLCVFDVTLTLSSPLANSNL